MIWFVLKSGIVYSVKHYNCFGNIHDDVIKWKHFPRYWPFVRGIRRSAVNSPHKGQWRGALMFSLICAGINAWVNNRDAGDLRRHRGHCDVSVMTHFLETNIFGQQKHLHRLVWTTVVLLAYALVWVPYGICLVIYVYVLLWLMIIDVLLSLTLFWHLQWQHYRHCTSQRIAKDNKSVYQMTCRWHYFR